MIILSRGADPELEACDHEESDIRLVAHIVDAL